MENKEIIERLGSLMRLDHDAVLAYNRAIDDISTRSIKTALQRFRSDHERHVGTLGDMIRNAGGEPPSLSRDARGVFLEGMTAIQSEMGERAALKACETGEKYVNYKYNQAVNDDFPRHVKQLLERNYDDEKRHLAYIQERLQAMPRKAHLGRTIGLGALGVAAGMVIWRQIAART